VVRRRGRGRAHAYRARRRCNRSGRRASCSRPAIGPGAEARGERSPGPVLRRDGGDSHVERRNPGARLSATVTAEKGWRQQLAEKSRWVPSCDGTTEACASIVVMSEQRDHRAACSAIMALRVRRRAGEWAPAFCREKSLGPVLRPDDGGLRVDRRDVGTA
jgi:hypothetical protein